MSEVNYDDFCGNWRIFDADAGSWSARLKVRARCSIYCKSGSYYFDARSGFLGGMNNSGVPLVKAAELHGDYAGGTPLEGGLIGSFGSAGWVAFTLNDMTEGAFVISLSETTAPEASASDAEATRSHGGPHGVPD